jgi:hypothetical protein
MFCKLWIKWNLKAIDEKGLTEGHFTSACENANKTVR